MSEVPFYKTRMGQRLYEQTMPELVEQLKRLNEPLERFAQAHQDDPDSGGSAS